jgi:hypothetical protein
MNFSFKPWAWSLLSISFVSIFYFDLPAQDLSKEAESQVVFNKGQWRENWTTTPFGGLKIENVKDEKGMTSFRVKVLEGSKDWSGVFIKCEKKENAIQLEKDSEHYSCVFYINGDSDDFGSAVGGQNIQFNLGIGGKPFSKEYLSLKKYLDSKVIDADSNSWQKVRIPLLAFGIKKDIRDIDWISFQFIGAAPKAGFLIREMFIIENDKSPQLRPAMELKSQNSNVYFPEFKDISPTLLMPKKEQILVDQDGNYLVNGKVRFLLGTQIEAEILSGRAHRPGYDEKYNWIYDEPLSYEISQRLGFDSFGYFTPPSWTRSHTGEKNSFGLGTSPEDEKGMDLFLQTISLPLYVDMTCFEWAHGRLAKKTNLISLEAASAPFKNHFLPYSIARPEGIALYQEMMRAITKRVLENDAQPLFYELFNEPAYYDDNVFNRKLFVDFLTAKYKNIFLLNQVWQSHYADFEEISLFKTTSENLGLYVDWCKFLESLFTQLCLIGKETVRSIDTRKDTRFSVQVMGMNYFRKLPATGVNIYEVSKHMEVISTPTGGGISKMGVGLTSAPLRAIDAGNLVEKEGLLVGHFFRGLGEGKPVHDGEFYGGENKKNLINGWWLEIARGYSASYLFKWDKRAWDWKSEEEGKKKAEQYDYLWLNPYCRTPEVISGVMDFKKEFKTVEDLLVPKNRNVKTEIALMLSFPTERAADLTHCQHNEILSYASALEFSHFPYDVLPEEEITSSKGARYKILVMAGVRNVYAQTPAYLEKFATGGGIVVMALDLPAFDEYDSACAWEGVSGITLGEKLKGNLENIKLDFPQWNLLPGTIRALPFYDVHFEKSWTVLASASSAPVLLSKKFGKGKVYFINAKFSDYVLTSFLASLLKQENILRPYDLADSKSGELSPNVEIHSAQGKNENTYFLFNWDLYSKLVYLKPETLAVNMNSVCDPLLGERYEVSEKGVLLELAPQERKVLVWGDKTSSRQNFALKKESEVTLRFQENVLAQQKVLNDKTEIEQKQVQDQKYKVDLNKLVKLDLRKYCNRKFEDTKPGDEQGGWTDQGENSLRGVPDGIQTFLGVPFDIIRWDMNGDKSCIVLGSLNSKGTPTEIKDIPVDEKMKSLYFLQACGWATAGKEAFRYEVHYQDGTSETLPMIVGQQVDDWWLNKNIKAARIAWKNSENKGFYAYQWGNPHPEKRLRSIDIVSSQGQPVPIIIAISGEKVE